MEAEPSSKTATHGLGGEQCREVRGQEILSVMVAIFYWKSSSEVAIESSAKRGSFLCQIRLFMRLLPLPTHSNEGEITASLEKSNILISTNFTTFLSSLIFRFFPDFVW